MAARQGAKHHSAKLTVAKVRQARKTYAGGKTTVRQLAEKYGVAHQTMWAAIKGQTWKNVT